jgi:hypothetical protein
MTLVNLRWTSELEGPEGSCRRTFGYQDFWLLEVPRDNGEPPAMSREVYASCHLLGSPPQATHTILSDPAKAFALVACAVPREVI